MKSFNFPKLNPKDILSKIAGICILLIIYLLSSLGANLVVGFLGGIASVVGGNLTVSGVNQVTFEPLLTIAYLMVYYFLTLFYQPVVQKQFYLFLLTLLLSFMVNFLQGSILLVILYWALRKTKYI